MKHRAVFQSLSERLQEPRRSFQVLLGPRQVGKTTLALQLADTLGIPSHYATADLAALQDLSWLQQQWESARDLTRNHQRALLIVDEIQKIPHWSDLVKALWDEDTRTKIHLQVLLLGSSPWLMQKRLTESLAGRFETIPIPHWSYEEMHRSFGWSVDQYVYFGGYPGAAPLADVEDTARWANYIGDSLIETTISRDILLMTQVNKPVLLRRLFQLACRYSGQILSYSKLRGQLQDAGNTTTVAHYLNLLDGAGLLCGLQKFAVQPFRQKSSSPKYAVYNTALMSAQSQKSYQDAQADREYWGRLVESAVGAHLLNDTRGTSIELSYWKEGSFEVDFVLKQGEHLTAIEVKSNRGAIKAKGMDAFAQKFRPTQILLVGDAGMPLERFLRTPVSDLVRF